MRHIFKIKLINTLSVYFFNCGIQFFCLSARSPVFKAMFEHEMSEKKQVSVEKINHSH